MAWLGEVPGVWQVSRLKRICRFVYGDSLPTETRQEGNVPVFGSNGGVGFHTAANTHAPCIVIGRKGSFGKVNFSQVPVFAIDTTYFVDDRYTHADLRWLAYLLVSLKLDGISKDSAVPGLAREDAYAQHAAYPASIDEQVAIVRYLDHADRKVRHAIRARQQLIKLLTEQKQAIIHRAVTRGLNPNVRLKPSGVPWLGGMPEHWEILRLKDACQRIVGGSTPRSDKAEYWNGDVVWVTPIDVTRSQRLDTSLRRITREGLNSCSATLVPAGSIIVTCRAPVGKVAVAATELCTNQGCKAVVLRSEVLTTAFGALLMQTLEPELQSLANGTTFSEIPLHKLACVPIPVPTIGEQDAIVRDVDDATANADKAIDVAHREIDLLREYRTRLIADVVTGKLDVRGVPVPADETDILPEGLEDIDDVEAIDQTDDVAEGDSESSSEESA